MATLKDIRYNCKRATYLVEKKQFGAITLLERFQLSYHLAGCSVCRIYQKQSEYISQVLQKAYTDFESSQLELSTGYKAELQQMINQRTGLL